jgi:TRPM family ion channel
VDLTDRPAGLAAAVAALGLGAPRPVVAVVGGAAGLDRAPVHDLEALLADPVARLIRRFGAIAVDGGTDTGVMGMLGRARAAGPGFPLVGVAARKLVRLPGEAAPGGDFAEAEPHHTHFVLVPGTAWGAEAQWLARVATLLAGPAPSVTILANGGDVAIDDCRFSLAEGRPVLVLAGTGRTADRIAAAASDPAGCRDSGVVGLALSPEVRVVDANNRVEVESRMLELLGQ